MGLESLSDNATVSLSLSFFALERLFLFVDFTTELSLVFLLVAATELDALDSVLFLFVDSVPLLAESTHSKLFLTLFLLLLDGTSGLLSEREEDLVRFSGGQ